MNGTRRRWQRGSGLELRLVWSVAAAAGVMDEQTFSCGRGGAAAASVPDQSKSTRAAAQARALEYINYYTTTTGQLHYALHIAHYCKHCTRQSLICIYTDRPSITHTPSTPYIFIVTHGGGGGAARRAACAHSLPSLLAVARRPARRGAKRPN